MYILIVGAGEVGAYVARAFLEEGHEVAVIERDEDVARRLDASCSALVVRGSGVNPDILKQAGVEQADLLLAVTATDEVNLIACMTAKKHGKEGLRALARVRESWHGAGESALSAKDLGLDALISPRQGIVEQTMDSLQFAGSGEMRELADGKVVLVGMVLGSDSPMIHENLAEVRSGFAKDFLVVAVQESRGTRIPSGGDRFRPGDRLFVLTQPQNLTELVILSGQPWFHVRRVLIVGCGNTGLAVARELERQKFAPAIIEEDEERAELIAGMLPGSLVLHGDGSDPDLLQSKIEEREIDTVLVLLKDPVESVLIGIFAKSLGARKVVVRCDESGYVPLAHKLGVDAVLSPNRAVIDAILRYVRKGNVGSALLLGEHEVEIIELKVPEEPAHADLVRKPLKDLRLPEGSLIGAVVRDGETFLPSGNTVLRPGDDLFVACERRALRSMEEFLS